MNCSEPAARPKARTPRLLAIALAAIVLGSCDARGVIIGTGATGHVLRSGSYDYRAWSDRFRDLAWWGHLDIRVSSDGRISGHYRLPRQCSDRFGPGADCVGRVGGRVYRDGTVRFGFDEGWLSHDGFVTRRSDVNGHWWTRMLGHSDEGSFELLRF